MLRQTISAITACVCAIVSTLNALPAFPGAEGYGSETVHGRGGAIIEVTNLDDNGEGSLRAALTTEGARIVVFRVGGVIQLQENIVVMDPHCYIAGQTAPGDGICIVGAGLNIATHDVVVRYLRIRPGDGPGHDPEDRDCLAVWPWPLHWAGEDPHAYNVMIDHCSFSWGTDENVSFYGALDTAGHAVVRDCSLQWCIVSECLAGSLHPKGEHSKGVLVAGGAHRISIHHCLLAHNHERHPLFKTGTNGDLVNNVLFDSPWGAGMVDEDQGMWHPHPSVLNIIGCTAVASQEGEHASDSYAHVLSLNGDYMTRPVSIFLSNNRTPARTSDTQDQWDAAYTQNLDVTSVRVDNRALDAPAISTDPHDTAYERVLDSAGALLPVRDPVDTRVVQEVRDRTGDLVDSPSDVGGYPSYASGTPYVDSDRDGMDDEWENGMFGTLDNDGKADADSDGYTDVEEFLNGTLPVPATHRLPSAFAAPGRQCRSPIASAVDIRGRSVGNTQTLGLPLGVYLVCSDPSGQMEKRVSSQPRKCR